MSSSSQGEQSPREFITSHADYLNKLERIEKLFSSKRGTPEGAELEALLSRVEAYEEAVFSIEPPDPIEALRFRIEQEQSES